MCLTISGGHLNPAVTLAMACLGKLKWRKVPVYFLAQYLGCFIASAVLFAIYADAFNAHDRGSFRHVTNIILLRNIRITTEWFSISKNCERKVWLIIFSTKKWKNWLQSTWTVNTWEAIERSLRTRWPPPASLHPTRKTTCHGETDWLIRYEKSKRKKQFLIQISKQKIHFFVF